MSIKITGIKESVRTFRRIESLLKSKEPMEGVIEDVKKRIEERTAAGKDYRGRRFDPYSEAYAKRKKKTRVDLRDSGLMLESLTTKVINPRHGRVFIKPAKYSRKKGKARTDMVAQIHTTGSGKQPHREFVNITNNALNEMVKKHYDDRILRILGRA